MTEKCQVEKLRTEKFLTALNNGKSQTMSAVGDMISNNEVLEQRIKDLTNPAEGPGNRKRSGTCGNRKAEGEKNRFFA